MSIFESREKKVPCLSGQIDKGAISTCIIKNMKTKYSVLYDASIPGLQVLISF